MVEEVARHHGYDTIGKAVPNSTMHGRLSTVQLRRRQLREVLLGLGLSEAITDSFLHRDDLGKADLPDDAIHVTNPLQADEDVLRPTMRVGMLKAIAFNESHRRPGVQLFEIGHVYPPGDRRSELPPEYEGLSVALAGADARAAMATWREIAKAMGFGARVDQGTVPAGLHPTRSATLSLGKDVVVSAGAKVLGGFEVGDGAKIGSNAVVIKPVPAGATAVGIPARIIPSKAGESADVATAGKFAAYGVTNEDDPLSQAMRALIDGTANQEHQITLLWQAIEKLSSGARELPGTDCVPQDAQTSEVFDAARLSRLVK